MMTTQKLKALVNTVIKQSTLDSSQITDLTQKFSLTAGDKIEINDYKSADNNHWELLSYMTPKSLCKQPRMVGRGQRRSLDIHHHRTQHLPTSDLVSPAHRSARPAHRPSPSSARRSPKHAGAAHAPRRRPAARHAPAPRVVPPAH